MTDLGYDIIKLKGREKVEGIENIKAQCGQQLLKHPVRPRSSESAGLQEADAYWVLMLRYHFPIVQRYRI